MRALGVARGGIAALLLIGLLLMRPPAVGAEEHDVITLEPRYGDGRLTIIGNDFKPRERVTITAEVAGKTYTFTTTADAAGSFRLETGVPVPPGSSVSLEARGDQGTGRAAITSGPGLLPPGAGAPDAQPPAPSQLPRTGDPATSEPASPLWLIGGLMALAVGLGLWRLHRRRPAA